VLGFDEVERRLLSVLYGLPKEVLRNVGIKASESMRDGGGRPVDNYITNRTRMLWNAVRGGKNSQDTYDRYGDEVLASRKILLPYAYIQEFGGKIPITSIRQIIAARMRMREQGYYDPSKRGTGSKGVINIPARPFIRKGIEATKENLGSILVDLIKKEFGDKIVVEYP
jgi:hypothetical protein